MFEIIEFEKRQEFSQLCANLSIKFKIEKNSDTGKWMWSKLNGVNKWTLLRNLQFQNLFKQQDDPTLHHRLKDIRRVNF